MKQTQRILVMGLPGAGKTTLASALRDALQDNNQSVFWFNADTVREAWQDWDFSTEGRIRQSKRMRDLADSCGTQWVIADFVCPLKEMRDNFAANWIIWVDTIKAGRFEDTNKAFVPPEEYDFHITTQEAPYWSKLIAQSIIGNKRARI